MNFEKLQDEIGRYISSTESKLDPSHINYSSAVGNQDINRYKISYTHNDYKFYICMRKDNIHFVNLWFIPAPVVALCLKFVRLSDGSYIKCMDDLDNNCMNIINRNISKVPLGDFRPGKFDLSSLDDKAVDQLAKDLSDKLIDESLSTAPQLNKAAHEISKGYALGSNKKQKNTSKPFNFWTLLMWLNDNGIRLVSFDNTDATVMKITKGKPQFKINFDVPTKPNPDADSIFAFLDSGRSVKMYHSNAKNLALLYTALKKIHHFQIYLVKKYRPLQRKYEKESEESDK